jgi:hypothetical protein
MTLRQKRFGGDKTSLRDRWPAVRESIVYQLGMIPPSQSIPFMGGQDDTFDN